MRRLYLAMLLAIGACNGGGGSTADWVVPTPPSEGKGEQTHISGVVKFYQVEGGFYAIQSEISRLEQGLAHGRELRDRQQQERSESEQARTQLEADIERDREQLHELARALAQFEPDLVTSREAEAVSAAALHAAEEALDAWQERSAAYHLEVREQHRDVGVRLVAE